MPKHFMFCEGYYTLVKERREIRLIYPYPQNTAHRVFHRKQQKGDLWQLFFSDTLTEALLERG